MEAFSYQAQVKIIPSQGSFGRLVIGLILFITPSIKHIAWHMGTHVGSMSKCLTFYVADPGHTEIRK